MLDIEQSGAPEPGASENESTPPAPRRRSASRPAGAPAPIVVAATADEPAPVAEATPAKAPTRRRATQKAAVAAKVDESSAVVPDDPSADESAPKRRTTRSTTARSAATRSTAARGTAKKAAAPDEPPAANAVADAEQVADESAAVTPKRVARKTTTAARSRKPAKAEAEVEPSPVSTPDGESLALGDADEVAASLGQLRKRGTQTRKRGAKAQVFDVTADSPEGVLDALAAAISGDPASDSGQEPGEAGDASDFADENGDFEPRRNRRRRRGGRRRRRSGEGDEAGADPEDGAEADDADSDENEAGEDGPDVSDGSGDGVRRRRRRRRRGEDIGDAEDDPSTEVVVRIREPRRTSANDEVVSIEGSTRMEAKRQRRREGRSSGRRRAPILSEAEFLARRESVERTMLIRQAGDYSQIAVLEDGILVEHYVDREAANSMIGNIYLGRVQNVLPSMEAAFIDIGRHRNAVLYSGEVDWEASELTGADKKIEGAFKSGQQVLVQVSKDPVGTKGARLTAHLSIPGRYIVYSPGGHLSGVSRKLPDGERQRLKSILDELIPQKASVIVRTAAEGTSEEELVRDVNRVKAQWEVIEKKAASEQGPQLLYSEPDLSIRIVRDLFSEDFTRLVIDGNGQLDDAYDSISAYIEHVAPHLSERLERWDRNISGDLFDAHRVQEQVMKALERKVFLPSGGSLVIDRTEAMTVIDVNTGRFTGTAGNLEATVTANNLEAAEEIVRQLRLRDIGGIIVIDFIDMVLSANRELLLRRLVECLGRDRTRHQVAEVTSLGLVQMTRKKIGTGLAEAFTIPCETCKGRGYHVHDAPVVGQTAADGGERDQHRKGGKRSGGGKSKSKGEGKEKKSEKSESKPG